MFSHLKQWPERYYHYWYWLAHLKDKAKIISIDFTKPWISVILTQKMYLFSAICCEIVIQTFYTIYPLIIGLILDSQNFNYFTYLIAVWLIIIVIEYLSVYFTALLEIQSINSIQFGAFLFFLTVDPIFHALKTSGKLFAKIERGARSYEDFLDTLLWDILPIIVSVTAVIVSFLLKDIMLGLVATALLFCIAVINISLNILTSLAFEKKIIAADDTMKSLSVESLTQISLIRSSFATPEIMLKTKAAANDMMVKEGTAWLAFSASITISRLIYLLSVFVLGYFLFSFIAQGKVSVLLGTTLLLTYINGTYEIIQIGRKLRKLLKAIIRIQDLFAFVRDFGKQTFPVLATDTHKEMTIPKNDVIELEVENLHFDYNPKAKVFEHHRLYLAVSKDQTNKLYGIIGPSGVGKTTLLSILGGQLRPDQGTITLNGIPIYQITDNQRRQVIAIQGQISSSLSGTVKSSLLLGLPIDQHIYTDEHIIAILEQVGIWNLFVEKEGLKTPVGESGLTLSGGQRQRLNFANLYLRAQYYKPLLILIDEPTSSLDEVSEASITRMITQLAQSALTFVIAHRLKTLDDANAILDFSLIGTEKDITFFTHDELIEKSVYYKKLIEGDITIEA